MYELIDGEQWEVMPNENYAISNQGRLMRTTPAQGACIGKIIKTHPVNGYLVCRMQVECKKTRLAIHVAVAEAFIGPRPEGMIISHRDGNLRNNTPGNLYYKFPGKTGVRVFRRHTDKVRCRTPGFRGRVYSAAVIEQVRTAKHSPPPCICYDSTIIAGERWEVLSCERYAISNFGRMMRTAEGVNTYPGKLLKARHNSRNYIQFVVSGRRHVQAHRMVAEHFIGSCEHGMQVNHIDGIPTNNHVSNLEYVTALDNTAHAIQTGLASRGKRKRSMQGACSQ